MIQQALSRFHWAGIFPLPRVVAFVNALCVAALALTAAELTWRLLPAPVATVGNPVLSATATGPVEAEGPPRLLPLADLSLFGQPPEGGIAEELPVEPVQPAVNLILRGVLSTGSAKGARAIIEAVGGEERHYKVGEVLPGGARLEEVLPDRIVVNRAGMKETISLPRDFSGEGGGGGGGEYAGDGGDDDGSMTGDVPRPYTPAIASGGDNSSRRLSSYRERFMSNPQEALNFVRMQPAFEAGKLKGYRLSPNRDPQLFAQAGLRPGDVVTSVNGLSLDDPAKMDQVVNQLKTAQQLSLTVERGGRQQMVVVSFAQ